MPRRTALIVGNLEYQDERLSKLVSPQADVLELASVLQSAQLGQFDEVRTLFNQTHGLVTREMWRFFRSATKADDMLLLELQLDPRFAARLLGVDIRRVVERHVRGRSCPWDGAGQTFSTSEAHEIF